MAKLLSIRFANWAIKRLRPIFAHVFIDGVPRVQSKNSAMQQIAPYLSLGVQLASTVLVCGAVGYWADIKLGSTPVGVLSGVVIGSVVGMIQFFRTVQRLAKSAQRDGSNHNGRQ